MGNSSHCNLSLEAIMKSIRSISFLSLLFFLIFSLTSCSSLNEAKKLHREGKRQEALNMAKEYLTSDDANERTQAIKLIGQIGGSGAGDAIVPLLDDGVVIVKNTAIENIGLLRFKPASKKLILMVQDAKGDTFDELARAIRLIGLPATDMLVKAHSKASESEQRQYKKMILEVGPVAADGIVANMTGKSYFQNRSNFDILIALRNPRVPELLLKYIENIEVAPMVVEGLGKLGTMSVSPVLRKLNEVISVSGKVDLKERLIEVLGEVKDQRAIGALETLTKDDSDRVRDRAAAALSKIRGF